MGDCFSYIKLQCPSYEPQIFECDMGSYAVNMYTSYCLDTMGSTSTRAWPKIKSLRDPSSTIHMADNRRPLLTYDLGFFWTAQIVRHRNGANFLYFDGHVQYLPVAKQGASSPEFTAAVDFRYQM
jgi:prepilin-type processing-associated H-X9-DG protein